MKKLTSRTSLSLFIFFLLLEFNFCFLFGCSSSSSTQNTPENRISYFDNSAPFKCDSSQPKVQLSPGDELDIKFFSVPELNETQHVRPDGMITLQFLGDISVQGLTPTEVREVLRDGLSNHIRNPEVAVIVKSLVDRRIFVSGEVNTPGVLDMPGKLTALEAIMYAGGFKLNTAELSNVVVIRHKAGKRYGCSINLDGVLEGETFESFVLEPNDIVFVPRTTIVNVTNWIDQHINRLLPLGFTLTYTELPWTLGIRQSGGIRVQ